MHKCHLIYIRTHDLPSFSGYLTDLSAMSEAEFLHTSQSFSCSFKVMAVIKYFIFHNISISIWSCSPTIYDYWTNTAENSNAIVNINLHVLMSISTPFHWINEPFLFGSSPRAFQFLKVHNFTALFDTAGFHIAPFLFTAIILQSRHTNTYENALYFVHYS